MNLDKIASIAGAIVVLATVTTVVTNGSNSANVIRAIGDAFSGSLRAAMGR